MEALVRGLGGRACDPTEHQCLLSGNTLETYEQAIKNGKTSWQALTEAKICDACQIFGATGWRRRFRLQVEAQAQAAWQEIPLLSIKPPNRTRGWFLPPGYIGQLRLTFHGDAQSLGRIYALIRFLEAWGNLGAKPQLGYGVFHLLSVKDTPEAAEWHTVSPPAFRHASHPDLRTFTFFKLRFSPRQETWWHDVPGLRQLRDQRPAWAALERLAAQGLVPVAPALKNHLRFEPQWSFNDLPHWLFGTLRRDERRRSKISFSWAYRTTDAWEIRGWVYLPDDAVGRRARAEIVAVLRRNVGEAQQWFRMLQLAPKDFQFAELTFAPLADWQTCSSQQVADFLNQTTWEQRT